MYIDNPSLHLRIYGVNMIMTIKWFVVALFTGLAFVVAKFTDEYFRPYKRKF